MGFANRNNTRYQFLITNLIEIYCQYSDNLI